ncbi:hypothetical protein CDAR_93601 [Caerostris darwini]|uniref:Uncharacterized protein n=1 Tax=Caerostris darwini TaxID=1538125 RepID=A0AAV4T141_9ARAC|nr:hypothetical protein CDAR_93601 [Caerostris darwini]
MIDMKVSMEGNGPSQVHQPVPSSPHSETVESVVCDVKSIYAGVSSMMEMEVSPDDSQSPFQGPLSPAAPEQHQLPQSLANHQIAHAYL